MNQSILISPGKKDLTPVSCLTLLFHRYLNPALIFKIKDKPIKNCLMAKKLRIKHLNKAFHLILPMPSLVLIRYILLFSAQDHAQALKLYI